MIDFEKINKKLGEINKEAYKLCEECGGQCEYKEVAWLFPGEKEFIAEKLKMSAKDFDNKFISKIKYRNYTVNLLRIEKCPFLKKYKCQLESLNAKPLICLFYPLYICIKNKKFNIYLDITDCPLAKKFPENFIKETKKIYKTIKNKIPAYWKGFIIKHDTIYDYKKMAKLKDKKFITEKELTECVKC